MQETDSQQVEFSPLVEAMTLNIVAAGGLILAAMLLSDSLALERTLPVTSTLPSNSRTNFVMAGTPTEGQHEDTRNHRWHWARIHN